MTVGMINETYKAMTCVTRLGIVGEDRVHATVSRDDSGTNSRIGLFTFGIRSSEILDIFCFRRHIIKN